MTAPTPRQFEIDVARTLARLKRHLAELPLLYEQAYGASHDRVVRASAGKITKGRSDPTEQIVGDPLDPLRPGAQAAIRRALERAPKKLAELENEVLSIEREISRTLDRLDPAPGFEPLRFPVSASNADLDESRAAQARRRARGEDIA